MLLPKQLAKGAKAVKIAAKGLKTVKPAKLTRAAKKLSAQKARAASKLSAQKKKAAEQAAEFAFADSGVKDDEA